jgi:hypothetical protein
MRRTVIVAAIAAVLLAAGVTWLVVQRGSTDRVMVRSDIDPDTMRLVPDTVRIKVELLNASGTRGIARRAMQYFRDRGFDVVSVGNASERTDSSVVLDRTGHPEWAQLAARALGGARVEVRPDTSRYLDLTILIGSLFRPPSQILYP